MFTSQHQKASFNIYAEKIIMTEVVPLFNECAMPTPQQFQQILENIANKYIQNTPWTQKHQKYASLFLINMNQ